MREGVVALGGVLLACFVHLLGGIWLKGTSPPQG
jgi:hypothetical protein